MSNELQAALLAWAFAAPLWLWFWAVWTGRLRWLNDNLVGPFSVTVAPGTAATATVAGLGFVAGWVELVAASLSFFVVGIVLHFVVAIRDPVWMQPGCSGRSAPQRRPTPALGARACRPVSPGRCARRWDSGCATTWPRYC